MGQLWRTKTRGLCSSHKFRFVLSLFWFSTPEWKRVIKILAGECCQIITWYWTGARRDQAFRLKEFPSRLYQRWLVGDVAWGSWRLVIGGKVTDFARCFAADWLWSSLKLAVWSNDFERLSSWLMRIDFGGISKWRVLMIALLSGDFLSLLFNRGGFIEILAGGGDESKSEKRRNIFQCFWIVWLID